MINRKDMFMKESILAEKSFDFSIRIVNFYKYLTDTKKNMFYQNNYYAVEQLLVHFRVKVVMLRVKSILFINTELHKKNVMRLSIG